MLQPGAEDELKLQVAALIRELEHKQVERVVHQLSPQANAAAVGSPRRRLSDNQVMGDDVADVTTQEASASESVLSLDEWMRSLKIADKSTPAYLEAFENLGVDGVDDLFAIDETDLEDAEVKKVHRKKMVKWIQEQQQR
jgi:hypothetical protein